MALAIAVVKKVIFKLHIIKWRSAVSSVANKDLANRADRYLKDNPFL